MGTRIRKLWSQKTIMIIDEVSIMDLGMLSVINNHCKTARSLDKTSTDFFGSMPMVILMGDFFQFPPIHGLPLWKTLRSENNDKHNGQLIWHQFKQVIILDEQMRQTNDPTFWSLLSQVRSRKLTINNLNLLNSKVIPLLIAPELENATIIVRLNSLCHLLNYTCLV
jgi:hypothetical protein